MKKKFACTNIYSLVLKLAIMRRESVRRLLTKSGLKQQNKSSTKKEYRIKLNPAGLSDVIEHRFTFLSHKDAVKVNQVGCQSSEPELTVYIQTHSFFFFLKRERPFCCRQMTCFLPLAV